MFSNLLRMIELNKILLRYACDHDNCPMDKYTTKGVVFDTLEPAIEFNKTTAISLGWLSCVSYLEEKAARKVLQEKGLTLHPKVENTYNVAGIDFATKAFVCSNRENLFVTFRGTRFDSFKDWLSDLFCSPVVWDSYGKVHEGFLRSHLCLWNNLQTGEGLQKSLQQHANGKKVWFTGHSMGSALAQLAAFHYAKTGGAVAGVYTLGPPRCGDDEFVQQYNSVLGDKSFLIVNNLDPVTLVPLKMMGYGHTQKVVQLAENGKITFKGEEDTNTDNEIPNLIKHILEVGMVDHIPANYAEHLRNGL